MSMLISNGYVVTMNAARDVHDGGFVAVDDHGAIESVGPASEAPSDEGRYCIDAGGMIVLPGLIDAAHQHWQNLLMGVGDGGNVFDLTASELKKFSARNMDVAMLGDSALVAAHTMLRGGTTTLLNTMPLAADQFVTAVVAGMHAAGVRQIQALPFAEPESGQLIARMTKAMRCSIHSDSMVGFALEIDSSLLALHQGRTDEKRMAEAHALARAYGLRIVSRTSSAEGDAPEAFLNALRVRGRSELLHLMELGLLDSSWLLIGAEWMRPADLSLVRESGCSMVCTPLSAVMRGQQPGGWPELLQAGVPCAFGTDTVANSFSVDLLDHMKACMLSVNAMRLDPTAMSAEMVLEMATIGGARALGIDQSVGSLEPGKRADIAVFNLNAVHTQVAHKPLSVFVACAGAIDAAWVMVDGRLRVRDGQLQTEGLDAALERSVCRARSLRRIFKADMTAARGA
jgi:5-methylthioadenosine/S-adenosylhomocysteine deaminase